MNPTTGAGSPPWATTRRLCAPAGLPPIHVVVGTDEILLDDTDALGTAAEKAGRCGFAQ